MTQQNPTEEIFPIRLARRFRKQQQFAAGYSPLYARLFGLLADWLAEKGEDDPLVGWLLQAGAARASFDVPLLLLAGVHRDVLTGVSEIADLARFYPTVGGSVPVAEYGLANAFRSAILARKDPLAEFLATATVQTNETARGLCWLLPVLFTGWPAIHLVDLGASAGLNLVADSRHYRLINDTEGKVVQDIGNGEPVQFLVASHGTLPLPSPQPAAPRILSRNGCDLAPFPLTTQRDEQTLASFVWGDQVERLVMLRKGIAALHRIRHSPAPVQLYPANLPDDLTCFLEQQMAPYKNAPVVLYNTYLTTYLHDKGASLRPQLAAWAAKQSFPVLWLQWETLWQGAKPPDLGWVGWTADLWLNGRHTHWHLAWTHPHGTHIQWLPESIAWADFWREQTR